MCIIQKSESTKMANIASFIQELQDNLSNEAYQTFKTELSKYKKVSCLCSDSYYAWAKQAGLFLIMILLYFFT